jgi:hypothetical protein
VARSEEGRKILARKGDIREYFLRRPIPGSG